MAAAAAARASTSDSQESAAPSLSNWTDSVKGVTSSSGMRQGVTRSSSFSEPSTPVEGTLSPDTAAVARHVLKGFTNLPK